MGIYSFRSWIRRRQGGDDLLPEADKVLPLVAQAGPRGITRSEIGKVIDLDRAALSTLLDALVQAGLLTVSRESGYEVFWSRSGAGG